ncbi:hypothetical protein B484DRAFT_117982, partial [Ochromonadaceae sp. CCMP2298]
MSLLINISKMPNVHWLLSMLLSLLLSLLLASQQEPPDKRDQRDQRPPLISTEVRVKLQRLQNSTKNHVSFQKLSQAYEYVSAPSSTVLARHGPKTAPALRFLHIPKTGSGLAATVVHYCCTGTEGVFLDPLMPFVSFLAPREFGPRCTSAAPVMQQPRSKNGDPWAHTPLCRDEAATIAFFREPADRLASQLAYQFTIGASLARSFSLSVLDAQVLDLLLKGDYSKRLGARLLLLDVKTAKSKPVVLETCAYRAPGAGTPLRADVYGGPSTLQQAEAVQLLEQKRVKRKREKAQGGVQTAKQGQGQGQG